MKRKVLSILIALVLALSLCLVTAGPVIAKGSAGKGNPPERVTVYADGTTATSTTTLVDDLRYRFEVSGTFSAGASITADAEYSSGPDSYEWQDLVEKYEGYGEGLLELKVNGEFVEWGEYNDEHTYSLYYIGTGSTVSFQIDDIYYPNNSGLLTVKISAAAKPTTFTTEYNQTQFQWRANKGQEFDDWWQIYRNSPSSSDFKLTGNVLHSSYVYSPVVTDLEGESTIYTYDKKEDLWIEKEGTVSYKYVPGYGNYTIANYWRGYLEFEGTPSEDSFVHGVAYQWCYLLAPQDEPPSLQYAQWDNTMDAWLVGFSIYLWDVGTQSYSTLFPDPFPEPVPARDYNPLDL